MRVWPSYAPNRTGRRHLGLRLGSLEFSHPASSVGTFRFGMPVETFTSYVETELFAATMCSRTVRYGRDEMSRDRGDDHGVEASRPDADAFVTVPNIGDGYFPELVITGWLVGDGQPVDSGAPLLTISTDKADFELQSPGCGTLEITAELNATVRIGQTVAIIHLTTRHNR
jgi:hypothetical protein